jgi:hypothetical protein
MEITLLYFPFPHSWNSFNRSHFSIYISEYRIFLPYSPSYTGFKLLWKQWLYVPSEGSSLCFTLLKKSYNSYRLKSVVKGTSFKALQESSSYFCTLSFLSLFSHMYLLSSRSLKFFHFYLECFSLFLKSYLNCSSTLLLRVLP